MVIIYVVFLAFSVRIRNSGDMMAVLLMGFTSLLGIVLGFTILGESAVFGILLTLFSFALLVYTFLSEPTQAGMKKK